jgi:hypothetical protein
MAGRLEANRTFLYTERSSCSCVVKQQYDEKSNA